VNNPDDTLPAPEEAEEAIAYNLALKLRPEYGVAMDPDTLEFAKSGLDALRRDIKVASPMTFDRCGTVYDIYTDTYR